MLLLLLPLPHAAAAEAAPRLCIYRYRPSHHSSFAINLLLFHWSLGPILNSFAPDLEEGMREFENLAI